MEGRIAEYTAIRQELTAEKSNLLKNIDEKEDLLRSLKLDLYSSKEAVEMLTDKLRINEQDCRKAA